MAPVILEAVLKRKKIYIRWLRQTRLLRTIGGSVGDYI